MKKSHFLLIAFIALFVLSNTFNIIPMPLPLHSLVSNATGGTVRSHVDNSGNGGTVSCTLSNVVSGDLIVVALSGLMFSTLTGISDSLTDTYSATVQSYLLTSRFSGIEQTVAKANISSDVITATFTGGVNLWQMSCFDTYGYGKVALTGSYHQTGLSSLSPQLNSPLAQTQGDLDVAAVSINFTCSSCSAPQITGTTGFTLNPSPAGISSAIEYASSLTGTNTNFLFNVALGTSSPPYAFQEVGAVFESVYNVEFAETGIPGTIAQMLVVNNTIYQQNQLPVSFSYTGSSTYTYGFYQYVGLYTFQSVSGCGETAKDATFTVSAGCTLTATYALTPNINNQSQTVEAINNQITAIIIFIVPSLLILFIFLWVGTEMFHLEGDGLIILMMLAIGAESAVNSMIANTFLPIWIGGLAITFMFAGLVYKRR